MQEHQPSSGTQDNQMIEAVIKVCYQGGTYVARCSGHKKTTSCTHSSEVAVRRHAGKLWPILHSITRLELKEVVKGVEHWSVQMEEL